MEKRNKVLMVSKIMVQKRITSEYGIMLRMNRSIQAGRTGNHFCVKIDIEFDG